ncbi:MAG: hypothetical protein WBA10_17855 [Elainellaceae cyanobacterium]
MSFLIAQPFALPARLTRAISSDYGDSKPATSLSSTRLFHCRLTSSTI